VVGGRRSAVGGCTVMIESNLLAFDRVK